MSGPPIHVMSWNIRRRIPTPLARPVDRWDRRAPRVRAVLREALPTILGAQEVLPDQMPALREGLGDGYEAIGRGRGRNGEGEACPILYDGRRLALLDQQQRALSATPEIAGSSSWGNLVPRVMVIAEFRDRATSARLVVVNTHLDHLSARSRVRSAQAIREVVTARGLPAVVTGDLNAGRGSATLRDLLAGGDLVDSWERADLRETEDWGTYTGYRRPRVGGPRLDWIVVSPSIRVRSVSVDADRPADGWPSDHLAVHAWLDAPGEESVT